MYRFCRRASREGGTSVGGIGVVVVGLLAVWLTGCASGAERFDDEVVWQVNDRRPIDKPDERWVPKYWGAADANLFRPVSRALLVEPRGPAQNVNAWGHVPNSSWYTNRLARYDIGPERVARGPCRRMKMERGERWVIKGGKIGGNNPGFVIDVVAEDGSEQSFLLKFDGELQTERATAADVLGSKIYWAAGFEVPCNRVVYFDRDRLVLDEEATKENLLGQESPLTREDVRQAMKYTPRLEDGRVRAVASRFLPGEPLGPFNYAGRRSDDPNDAVRHEDRRELRGSRLIAAWINHFDARQQNTYTSFISPEDSELGYVQHFMLDFGDSFGSRWPSDGMSRRFGHSWYVDWADIATDFITLGAISRPWHDLRTYSEAPIFGYFDITHFEPSEWKAGTPNLAFRHMDDRDAFWATHIISKFSDAHIERLVAEAKFTKPSYSRYLERVLIGRRDRIVATYFQQMSPLVEPAAGGGRFCVTDAWTAGGYGAPEDGFHDVRLVEHGSEPGAWRSLDRTPDASGRICLDVPSPKARSARGGDLVVHWRVRRADQRDPARPARFFLRPNGSGSYSVVGILRVGDRP